MYRLILVSLLSFVLSYGQSTYESELIQFTDGLPSDVVFMTTKKDGFLYVATQRGLCIYDGYIFVNSPDLAGTVLFVIEKNNKVYGEELGSGLFEIANVYDPKRMIASVNYWDTIQNNDHYHNVYTDDHGNVWSSDFHFAKYFNPVTNTTKEFRILDDSKELEIEITYLETSEELIVITSKGLFVWEKKTDKWTKLTDIEFSSGIELGKKFYLLSTTGELFEYLSDNRQLSSLKKLPLEKPATIIENVSNANLMILYDDEKIYHYTLQSNTLETVFVSESRINHVFHDEDTRIFWVSTQGGLIKLTKEPDAIQTISLPDISKTPVTDMVEDENNRVFIVKNSRNLFLLDGGVVRNVTIDEQQLNRISFTGNKLLLATGTGVYRKEENDVFRKIITTDVAIKKAIYFDQKYWLIVEKGPIRVYDTKTLMELPNYVKNDEEYWKINLFNDFEVSADNQLWMTSWMPKDFGISKFDNNKQKFIEISTIKENEKLFVADYFHRVSRLQNGNMIFSSTGGFNIVNPKGEIVYSMFPRVEKVVCDNIIGIGEDYKGNIWFGCAEGLYQYNLTINTPVRISKFDGLLSNDITYGFLITKDNSLYISNDKTLEKINPDGILNTELINKLEVTAIRVNDKYLPYISNELSFREKEVTQIELFFSALNFSKKEKLVYRYKFKGEEWHYLGSEPKLSLIKPTSGKYNIIIEAGDNLGNWQQKNLEIKLNIIPPFYKTIWFALVLFAGFFIGAHFFNVYLVNQEKEKGELKKKIKDNENKMLRSQMNPHFLFNSLNSINSFIIQNKADEAEKYLTAFSKLMRNILDNSRKETISLKQELETVKLYLDLEAVRMENKFDYRITITKEVDTDYVQIPPLILQPFLENAIWHGINYKQGDGFIDIDVTTHDENNTILIIKIKDDGVGRKAASKWKNKEYAHKSYGIDITRERLELQGTYNSIEISDLYDDSKEPSGTLVTLKIQIKND